MTRQKKEIIRRINALMDFMDADMALGYWSAPASKSCYEELDRLYEQLAHLSHYSCAAEMFNDERDCR